MVNSIEDEVWFADTEKRFTLANPSALQEFGFGSLDEIEVEKFAGSLKVYRPDGSLRPVEEAPPLRALKGEVVRNLEEIIRTPARGELRYRQVSAAPVRDPNGNIIGSVAIARDVTDIKRAADALKKSEERFRGVFESNVAGIAFWRADGALMQVNQAFCDLLGCTPEEVQSGKVRWTDLTPPGLLPRDRQSIEEINATGFCLPYEKEFIHRDGRRIPVLIAGARLGEIPDEGVAIAIDLTERKRMEESLRKTNERLDILSETSSRLLAAEKPQEIVNELCERVMTFLDCHAFFNFLVDDEEQRLRLNAYAGIPEDAAKQIEWLDFGVAVCGCAARDGCRIVAENIPETPDPRTDLVKSFGIKAYACHPLMSRGRVIGTLSFGTRTRTHFSDEDLLLMKTVADQVAIAMERMTLLENLRRSRDELEVRVYERTEELEIANKDLMGEIAVRQQTEEALRKLTDNLNQHVREANCLYSVSYHVGKQYLSLGERLQHIVDCIPPGWQYPEVAWARIVFEGKEYKTDNYKETAWVQSSDIIADSEKVGIVEVGYLEERPERDEGPFLKEERNVINAIAIEIGEMIGHARAEEALKAERQRLNEVLEVLPAYVVLLTPDYHVPFANRVFRERFGESHGRRCFEYLFGRSEPCEICDTYTVLRTMAPHEWEWTGPDGRDYQVFDFPFTDTDGSTLILEMGIDVTERKRAEEAVKAASLYTRSLIEASLDPLVTISADGKVTDVNKATELATGVPRGQLIGSDFSDYFTEPIKAKAGYQRVFLEGVVRDYPLAIRHASGKVTDVLYNAAVYRNEAGDVQGVFAAARDITERKRAEEALRESESQLRYLSSELFKAQENERKRIARELHDGLGQNLTAMKFRIESYLQGIKPARMKAKAEPLGNVVTMIQESVREIHRIQTNLRPSVLDDLGILATLSWFCREYESTYKNIIVEKEIAIRESEVPEPLKMVIYRILQEALNNVSKHSGADRVQLSLRKGEGSIELLVRDNGKGFNFEGMVFEKGHREGLGLPSMKERAENSRGTYFIESAPGQGTTIKVTWNLAEE